MVNFHQAHFPAQPVRITVKNPASIPSSTTPPIPQGTLGQNLPGVRPSPVQHRQASPGMIDPTQRGMNPNESPGMPNAMSPMGNVMSPLGQRMIPGRVPTPQGHHSDGRLTPGSQGGGGGGNHGMNPGMNHGMPPLSPAHSQDSSRIPTPNAASPAQHTAPSPSPSNPASNNPVSAAGNTQQPGELQQQQQHGRPPINHNNIQNANQSQDEKLNKIKEIQKQMLGPKTSVNSARNPTPPGNPMTMDTLRQVQGRVVKRSLLNNAKHSVKQAICLNRRILTSPSSTRPLRLTADVRRHPLPILRNRRTFHQTYFVPARISFSKHSLTKNAVNKTQLTIVKNKLL